jgi:ADP-dependent phosphofructokinase/glucokinase
MGYKVAMGFHSAVDYELNWDAGVITTLASQYDIHEKELSMDLAIKTERDLIVVTLAHLKAGIGGEFIPESNDICVRFAEHFQYRLTLGGTAQRAAIAISKLGYESLLSMCCFNEHMRRLLPPQVHYFSNVGYDSQDIYPHVILSYPANETIRVNDISFTTPRENRLMYSNDKYAKNMVVSAELAPMLKNIKAFLLGSFSEVVDFDILKARMASTGELFESIAPDAWIVYEDGCYINKDFRHYVHKSLAEFIDVLSMNEDEMQEYIGNRINLHDPVAVSEALSYVYKEIGVPVLVVHSASWTIAYGKYPEKLKDALNQGTCLSATRYRCGDYFGIEDYMDTMKLAPKKEGEEFCRSIKDRLGDLVCCLPAKNLSFVKNPTVVGLGDFFAGGLASSLIDIQKPTDWKRERL